MSSAFRTKNLHLFLIAALGFVVIAGCSQGTGATTDPTPVSMEESLSVSGFYDRFGNSLVTVFCDGPSTSAQGSGVVTPIQFEDPEILSDAKSFLSGRALAILTNFHVIEGCIDQEVTCLTSNEDNAVEKPCPYGSWYQRPVSLKHPSRPDDTFGGHIYAFDSDLDLAVIYTAAAFPESAPFLGGVVMKPLLGDQIVAIGSASGNPGTTTKGEVAALGELELLTTAQAAPGSSGGAVFNEIGQLVGLIQGARGTLLVAIPITQFCKILNWLPASQCKWTI